MSKSTQTFKLYEVLKSGEAVTVENIAAELGIEVKSVPVYIHGLKKAKGTIVPVREGRKVTSYKLTNAADLKIAEFRKNTTVDMPVKVSTVNEATLADDTGPVIPLGEKEIEDIHTSLDVPVSNSSWD